MARQSYLSMHVTGRLDKALEALLDKRHLNHEAELQEVIEAWEEAKKSYSYKLNQSFMSRLHP